MRSDYAAVQALLKQRVAHKRRPLDVDARIPPHPLMLVWFDDQAALAMSRPFGIVRSQIRNDNAI